MCPMWTTSGCLARRRPNHDSLNATRGIRLVAGFRGLPTPAYLYESGLFIDVNGLLRFGTALCTSVLARGAFQLKHRLRVAARIADANTSDDAAFNVAKDGEAAIAALNGAAAVERRRMIGKRKRCGAFAFAGSF